MSNGGETTPIHYGRLVGSLAGRCRRPVPVEVRQFVVVGLLIVAVAAIVTGGLAVFRWRDRSVLLVTALVLMVIAAGIFALGELLLPH